MKGGDMNVPSARVVVLIFMGWIICNNPNFRLASGVAVENGFTEIEAMSCCACAWLETHTFVSTHAAGIIIEKMQLAWGCWHFYMVFGACVHRFRCITILMLFMNLGISAWTHTGILRCSSLALQTSVGPSANLNELLVHINHSIIQSSRCCNLKKQNSNGTHAQIQMGSVSNCIQFTRNKENCFFVSITLYVLAGG